MSAYQRYEFMTSDRSLTREQLDGVRRPSSHIEASSTHALIEYKWGDYKHDPIETLYDYFDGFLYWANWGAAQLAFRFPRGALRADLLADYGMDLDDFVTFTQRAASDILDISFGEMESPDEWTEYELGSLMPLRNELMDGGRRVLYMVWLAAQRMLGSSDEEEEYEIAVPPIPFGFAALTGAQRALADLLQLPPPLLAAAAHHSATPKSAPPPLLAAVLAALPPDRRTEYLTRLAHNEPGLSRQLLIELRALRPATSSAAPVGERVTFATLLRESVASRGRWSVSEVNVSNRRASDACARSTNTRMSSGSLPRRRPSVAQGQATTTRRGSCSNCARSPTTLASCRGSRSAFVAGFSRTCAGPRSPNA